RHTRSKRDWSSDVCSSDLQAAPAKMRALAGARATWQPSEVRAQRLQVTGVAGLAIQDYGLAGIDRAADRRVVVAQRPGHLHAEEIGRASCRERVEIEGRAG